MIKLLFFGDVVCQSSQPISFSPELARQIADSDIAYCNFEAPIKGAGLPIIKSGPALTQYWEMPTKLETYGFNLVGLANNHMMDNGAEACKNTISSFKKAIIIGAGTNKDLYIPKVLEINGIKIGFLALTHKEFGTLDNESQMDDFGTAWINSSAVNRSIIESKLYCDLLFVLPHAGVENIDIPLPEWRSRYREFIDLGADAVIASHPHIPQGWELYRDCPIFYSLGNFIFDSISNNHSDYWNKGLGVAINVDDNKKITYKVINITNEQYKVSIDQSSRVKDHNKYLCSLLLDDKMYYETLDRILEKLWLEEYQLYILRGVGGVTLKSTFNTFIHAAYGLVKGMDIPMLFNNFQCESHRWAIERILKNKLYKK